jgi:hypothetical protein
MDKSRLSIGSRIEYSIKGMALLLLMLKLLGLLLSCCFDYRAVKQRCQIGFSEFMEEAILEEESIAA